MGNTTFANPAPLGLMGFGMTTILLNLHNIGLFPMDSIILRSEERRVGKECPV